MPPVVSIVGRKNAGKTTLVERLLPELVERGWRVGTLKHDVHGFQMDHPGKDTYRHFQAGAEAVVIFTDEQLAVNRRLRAPLSLADAVEQYLPDVDLVVTEGFKSGGAPKIEVRRAGLGQPPLQPRPEHLIAVAADDPALAEELEPLALDDVSAIADFIEERFLGGKKR